MADPQHIKDIFASYAKLRQARVSREDAWQRVKASADDFSENDRKRLIALIRDWEIIEGHRYQASRSHDPHATMFKPPEGLQEVREQLKAQREHADASPEQTRAAAPAETQAPAPDKPVRVMICPKCGTPNTFEAAQCVQCGIQLPQTQEIDPSAADQINADLQQTHVIRGMALKLQFPATSQVLRVPINRDQLVIGRGSGTKLMAPDIDLSPYDAQSKGVSRYHASLKCQGDTLVINDLESLNHTYINGQRLYPHESRVLREGDVLRLGQLVMHVFFLPQET